MRGSKKQTKSFHINIHASRCQCWGFFKSQVRNIFALCLSTWWQFFPVFFWCVFVSLRPFELDIEVLSPLSNHGIRGVCFPCDLPPSCLRITHEFFSIKALTCRCQRGISSSSLSTVCIMLIKVRWHTYIHSDSASVDTMVPALPNKAKNPDLSLTILFPAVHQYEPSKRIWHTV